MLGKQIGYRLVCPPLPGRLTHLHLHCPVGSSAFQARDSGPGLHPDPELRAHPIRTATSRRVLTRNIFTNQITSMATNGAKSIPETWVGIRRRIGSHTRSETRSR